ncbi:FIMAH domain-containing protein [Bacillus niameyensis]|uniref:FIMAH domain-containing protein n=1 Tax=Bacillus niameyensis TaxID=1522308 RepID=UPI001E2DF352|nr:lamin tail domain-containing protein [Bacillus niameyensis]
MRPPQLVSAEGNRLVNDQLPQLYITEIVAKTESEGDDFFEYIEVYNNTNKSIHLKDYQIYYRYPTGPEDDLVWSPSKGNEAQILPGKTMVLWLQNSYNGDKTIAEFNAYYGTSLVENKDIVRMEGSLISSRMRDIVIATNTGHEIAVASYNNGTHDVQKDKGILYQYPQAGSNQLSKISAGEKQATPGSVDSNQIPDKPIAIDDSAKLVINNLTKPESPSLGEIEFIVDAKSNNLVKTVTLYYKANKKSEYTKVNLKMHDSDSLYHHKIHNILDLIGSEFIEYYFTASDGYQEKTSEKYQILLGAEGVYLNVKDNDILSGEATIIATSGDGDPRKLQLSIDDKVIENTERAFAYPAYFIFEGHGMNKGALDAVTYNNEILQVIDYGVNNFETITVSVSPELIRPGENKFGIHAGSDEETYFEDKPTKKGTDDFDVRNVRLVLSDGTVIMDENFSDPIEVLPIGDSDANKPRYRYFTFKIPEEKSTSKAYKWNTSGVDDGEHFVKAFSSDGREATAKVLVDNSGPSIETTLEAGRQYKGEFIIDAKIDDPVAGLKSSTIHLDGKAIKVPYKTSSIDLSAGEHDLLVSAVDKAGNKSEEYINFSVVEERPYKPKVKTPVDGAVGIQTNPTLSVHVSDPTNDDLKVSFYQGQKYHLDSRANIQAYKHATNLEPPHEMIPEGEQELTEEEYAKLSSSEEQYVTVDSTTQFPYIRFEVQIDGEVSDKDIVEFTWGGKSLANRRVTMYAWNHTERKWLPLDAFVTKTEDDFLLKGNVVAEDFVRDHIVNVMVQDQISPPEDYDYTFIWMTDTQYYSQTFSHIYESQVDWVIENEDAMNIQYVFHTGDIVEHYHQEYEWNIADRLMGKLDKANIPYGVLAGNHDVGPGNDYTEFSKYFGENRFSDRAYYGESYKDNRGHYDLISANGNDYIMVYMGWGIEDEEIAWMNEILAAYPDRQAILSFHRYLQPSGERAPEGDRLFEEVVVPNSNVVMVLSGHYHGSALLVDEIDDDGDGTINRKVYQMLSDYQSGPEGGEGYFRILHVDTSSNTIFVNTYSPYKDDYHFFDPEEYPGMDEFTISLNLEPQVKRVATKYFEANVFSNKKIGTVEKVVSGKDAEFEWKGLKNDQIYYWYAVAEDNYGGRSVSDIWSFTTGEEVPVQLADIRGMVLDYIDSEDIQGPLVHPLQNKLKQAMHHYEKGSVPQAEKFMKDFLKQINQKQSENYITPEAKQALEQKVNELLEQWSTLD